MRERGQHSPLVGFNSNVRYRGHTFHIQTEDSGRARPHVTTLLFADGGHIIASCRSEYGAVLDQPDWEQVVKRRMQDQHRGVLRELMSGGLDKKIVTLLGPLPARSRPASHADSQPSERQSNGAASASAPPVTVPALPSSSVARHDERALMNLGSLVGPLLAEADTGSAAMSPGEQMKSQESGAHLQLNAERDSEGLGQVPRLHASRLQAMSVQPEIRELPATRPAVVFEANESSLFGLCQVNEESLNDVILSFISQELEPKE